MRGLGQSERYPHRIDFIKNLHQVLLQLESDLFTLEKGEEEERKKKNTTHHQSLFREANTKGLGLGQTHI